MTASLITRIQADISDALRAGDKTALTTLRTVLSAIQTAEKAGKTAVEFDDAQVIDVLSRERKRRIDTAAEYATAGRDDRAALELTEAALIESYLPRTLDPADTEALIADVLAGMPGATARDMGTVIKAVRDRATADGFLVDGRTVAEQVKAALA